MWFLPEVEKFYLKRRPRTGIRGLKILHDNARPHKSLAVRQKFKICGEDALSYSTVRRWMSLFREGRTSV